MLSFILSGGPYMLVLILIAIVILYLAVRKLIQLFNPEGMNREQFQYGLNAILFWSAIGLLIGLFAHFHGIYMAMQAIARASDISPAIVAHGYSLSLVTVLAGMFIFIVSLIIWFLLRWRFNKVLQAKPV